MNRVSEPLSLIYLRLFRSFRGLRRFETYTISCIQVNNVKAFKELWKRFVLYRQMGLARCLKTCEWLRDFVLGDVYAQNAHFIEHEH